MPILTQQLYSPLDIIGSSQSMATGLIRGKIQGHLLLYLARYHSNNTPILWIPYLSRNITKTKTKTKSKSKNSCCYGKLQMLANSYRWKHSKIISLGYPNNHILLVAPFVIFQDQSRKLGSWNVWGIGGLSCEQCWLDLFWQGDTHAYVFLQFSVLLGENYHAKYVLWPTVSRDEEYFT